MACPAILNNPFVKRGAESLFPNPALGSLSLLAGSRTILEIGLPWCFGVTKFVNLRISRVRFKSVRSSSIFPYFCLWQCTDGLALIANGPRTADAKTFQQQGLFASTPMVLEFSRYHLNPKP